MNAGDDRAGLRGSQDTWPPTSLNDPNAALWASIVPPAQPSLQTLIRRRVAALSLDALAQRLHQSLPGFFSSREMAQRGILGAAVAAGAAAGLVGYLGVTSLRSPPASAAPASGAAVQAAGVAPSAEPAAARPGVDPARSLRAAAPSTIAPGRHGATAVADAPSEAHPMAATIAPPAPEADTADTSALAPNEATAAKPRAQSRSKSKAKARSKAKLKSKHKRQLALEKKSPKSKATPQRTRNPRARALAEALGAMTATKR